MLKEKIDAYDILGKKKTASYAKDMCTMMYMAVNSYQLLKMGLDGKGE